MSLPNISTRASARDFTCGTISYGRAQEGASSAYCERLVTAPAFESTFWEQPNWSPARKLPAHLSDFAASRRLAQPLYGPKTAVSFHPAGYYGGRRCGIRAALSDRRGRGQGKP